MTTIERELHIEASPEIVYEVLTSPEHLVKWWPDEAKVSLAPGEPGTIAFLPDYPSVPLTVDEAIPVSRFAFTWAEDLQVTFTLTPSGTGTLVRFVESGHADAAGHAENVRGWDHFLPRLVEYVPTTVAA
ncbi:activator of HSP90 ATPase [Actinorhabdospora filicis]|uniref:Activator of HSP90 ATPase n=1 Tax=Actinorhabdospora filicis TaxID=1785913 RepID=A0A9W6W5Y7_9ACTN|nr:SRPBCC domain-containing protein [Actinorhabdospora filicis]GLZ80917.1 activator of HSP90 ATPase [Actinorhabdospora filicis]